MSRREREPSERSHLPLLSAVIKQAYPDANEVLAPFVDDLRFVGHIETDETALYIARYPTRHEHATRNHYPELSAEINMSLRFYRDYRLFLPWPQQTLVVTLDSTPANGRIGVVSGYGDLRVALHQVGQAQAWFGDTTAVLWECYVTEQRRHESWRDELRAFWTTVETDLDRSTFFTLPHEPTFPEGYTEFLTALGYQPDQAYSRWWSKRPERRPAEGYSM